MSTAAAIPRGWTPGCSIHRQTSPEPASVWPGRDTQPVHPVKALSMAPRSWAIGVWKFRRNVRLSVQQKCHSVEPRCYQTTTLNPLGVAALVDPQRPCISLWWLCGFPIPARLPEATSPCAGLSESPSIAPSEGTSVCAEMWLSACRRRPRCQYCPLDPSRSRSLSPVV